MKWIVLALMCLSVALLAGCKTVTANLTGSDAIDQAIANVRVGVGEYSRDTAETYTKLRARAITAFKTEAPVIASDPSKVSALADQFILTLDAIALEQKQQSDRDKAIDVNLTAIAKINDDFRSQNEKLADWSAETQKYIDLLKSKINPAPTPTP